jgi:hypothetical protein
VAETSALALDRQEVLERADEIGRAMASRAPATLVVLKTEDLVDPEGLARAWAAAHGDREKARTGAVVPSPARVSAEVPGALVVETSPGPAPARGPVAGCEAAPLVPASSSHAPSARPVLVALTAGLLPKVAVP